MLLITSSIRKTDQYRLWYYTHTTTNAQADHIIAPLPMDEHSDLMYGYTLIVVIIFLITGEYWINRYNKR